MKPGSCANMLEFQSTLPLRGATHRKGEGDHGPVISIHTPLAGSDGHVIRRYPDERISIHTPLAGSDWDIRGFDRSMLIFQSTLPLRGATRMDELCRDTIKFQSTLPLRGAT